MNATLLVVVVVVVAVVVLAAVVGMAAVAVVAQRRSTDFATGLIDRWSARHYLEFKAVQAREKDREAALRGKEGKIPDPRQREEPWEREMREAGMDSHSLKDRERWRRLMDPAHGDREFVQDFAHLFPGASGVVPAPIPDVPMAPALHRDPIPAGGSDPAPASVDDGGEV